MIQVENFLRDVYPGAKGTPTQLVAVMTSNDPKKSLETSAVLQQSEEPECDAESIEHIVSTLNQQLNDDGCPDPFQNIDDLGCVHSSQSGMTYDQATDYCKELNGAQLLYFTSFENLKALNKYYTTGNFQHN